MQAADAGDASSGTSDAETDGSPADGSGCLDCFRIDGARDAEADAATD
jgi:hypothetical protein